MRYMVHILANGKYWATRKYMSPRVLKKFLTKTQAINYALKRCKDGDEISIHNRDGQVDRFLKVET